MYLKRSRMPKTWPLPRKGTKYIVTPSHDLTKGLPLLVILRDILKLGKTKREVKSMLNLGKIKVNLKIVKNERYPLTLFDNLSVGEKNFRVVLKNRKFGVVEISEKESESKIAKVIGKKTVKKGNMQVNLSDGRNYLMKENIKVGNSVVINLKENRISDIMQLKQGSRIIFIAGKHTGEEGVVEKIDEKRKMALIKMDKEKINAGLESLMVVK